MELRSFISEALFSGIESAEVRGGLGDDVVEEGEVNATYFG